MKIYKQAVEPKYGCGFVFGLTKRDVKTEVEDGGFETIGSVEGCEFSVNKWDILDVLSDLASHPDFDHDHKEYL